MKRLPRLCAERVQAGQVLIKKLVESRAPNKISNAQELELLTASNQGKRGTSNPPVHGAPALDGFFYVSLKKGL